MDFLTIQKDKPFKPERAFRTKLFLYIIIVFISLVFITYIIFILMSLINSMDINQEEGNYFFIFIFLTFGDIIVLFFFWFNIAWIIPGIILVIYYVKSIEYSITDTDIIVRKGIINKTVTHIPFRTITNISTRCGVIDRALGIGNVEIQTAGRSSSKYPKPEAKIEGIGFYDEVRDALLNFIRQLTGQYTTTTENILFGGSNQNNIEFYQDLLQILNEIRDIVK
jgi:membrane protein YdbS with pleckstrin-like domain